MAISLGGSPSSPMASPKDRRSPSSPSGLIGLSPQSEGGKPRRRVVPPRQKLPREGPFPGRGRVHIHNRKEYDKVLAASRLHEHEHEHEHHPFEGDAETNRRPSTGIKASSKNTTRTTKMSSSARERSAGGEQSGAESSGREETETPGGGRSPAKEERRGRHEEHELRLDEKRALEIKAKWKKMDAIREKDAKTIRAHVDAMRDNKEARFNRMYAKITEPSGPEHRTGNMIRETEDLERKRLEYLHAQWSKKVYEPIAAQAFHRINRERAGGGIRRLSRSVSFHLPGESFKLIVDMKEHPSRQHIVEAGRENSLRRAAENVLLGRSYSDSSLVLRQDEGRSSPVATAQSAGPGYCSGPRNIDPSVWNPVPLRGTPTGYFPEGLDIPVQWQKNHIKAGHGVFLPDESDDVRTAGTHVCPTHGHHDKGILVGRRALGESMEHKTPYGASSGAPAQDHYTYDLGQSNAKLEWHYDKNKTVEQMLAR